MNLMSRGIRNAVRKFNQKKPAKTPAINETVEEVPTYTPPPLATTSQQDFSQCPSDINHPSVGDWQHHVHGQICCKCGTNTTTGEVLSKEDLSTFRENYW